MSHQYNLNVRGQALVETLLVSTVLLVLFCLTLFLGKLADIRWHTQLASRSLVFDCAALVTRCSDFAANASVVDDLRRRHFSAASRQLLSNDAIAAQPDAAEQKMLWRDRRQMPLIESMEHVTAKITPVNFDAWEGALRKAAHSDGAATLGSYVDKIMEAGPARFGLGLNEGLMQAKVQTQVSGNAPHGFATQLERMSLRLIGQTAVLGDDWAASGPGDNPAVLALAETSVAARVNRGRDIPVLSAFVRAANLPLIEFMKLIDTLGLEPNGNAFRYQQIDMDVIPADRAVQ